MARLGRIANAFAVLTFLLCLGGFSAWAQSSNKQQKQPAASPPPSPQAQQKPQPSPQPAKQAQPQSPQPASDKQQMRGLDEQIQEVKSDVLRMAADLSQLEEKLLYPSGTQVAVFVALAKGDTMRLDSVRLQIDGQLAAQYVYNAKELEALRKGGVQRLYVGNVATGEHKLEVVVEGKREGGADISRTDQFTFSKEVKPKLVEMTLDSGKSAITFGEF
jgi:hypothetical protein